MYQISKHFKAITLFLALATVTILLGVLTSVTAKEHKGSVHSWGYEGGTGPQHWGEIEADHEMHLMCREGIHQSPVDIQNVPGVRLEKLHSSYSKTPLQIINNKHTILLKYHPGSFIDWGKEKFEIIQFHFHHPSEHQVEGKSFPMEIHLVHKTQDHEYVIIAVFVKIGKHNPKIQKIWDRIPAEVDKEYIYENELLTAQDFLPSHKEYFHYNGSLTTPPCTENVTWLILEEPIEISETQVKYFQKFIDHNARPIQKLHHRVIVKVK